MVDGMDGPYLLSTMMLAVEGPHLSSTTAVVGDEPSTSGHPLKVSALFHIGQASKGHTCHIGAVSARRERYLLSRQSRKRQTSR